MGSTLGGGVVVATVLILYPMTLLSRLRLWSTLGLADSKLILLISLIILIVSSSLRSSFVDEDPSPYSGLVLTLLNNWDLLVILLFLSIFVTFFFLTFVGLTKLDIHDLSIFIFWEFDLILWIFCIGAWLSNFSASIIVTLVFGYIVLSSLSILFQNIINGYPYLFMSIPTVFILRDKKLLAKSSFRLT